MKDEILIAPVQDEQNPHTHKKITFKNIVSLTFVIIFMCIISVFPIMYFCGVSAGENYEKKVLTELPKIDELFTNYTGIAEDFEKHYNDYFPKRSNMLELYSLFEYKVLSTSLLPTTTSIGKNGWLFYESWGTRDAVSGKKRLTDKQLNNIYNGIMKKYNKLNSLGKKYIIYLAAEKQTIYPEYDRLTNAELTADYTLIEQLKEFLDNKNCPVPFIYSKDYLLTKKTDSNQLYFKYDTHWNQLGAHYGYEDVMFKIRGLLPEKEFQIVTEFDWKTTERSGDLATTLFLSNHLKEKLPVPKYKLTPTYKKESPITKVISKAPGDLKVFIYGDSFAQSEYWGACFAQSAKEVRIMHNGKTFEQLLANLGDCDVVVEECVQRVPTTLGRAVFKA